MRPSRKPTRRRTRLNFGAFERPGPPVAEQGGADVFASADQVNMAKVSDGGLLEGSPEVFARNRLEIIVAAGQPETDQGPIRSRGRRGEGGACGPRGAGRQVRGDALDRAG